MKYVLTLFASIMIAVSGYSQCTASFTYSNNNGTVSFNATSNAGPGATYSWWLSTGGNAWGTNPVVNFTSNGFYTVCLTVTDTSMNCSYTVCDSLAITNFPCNAAMYVTQSSGVVQGNNNSTGGGSYQWYVFDSTWSQVYTSANYNMYYQPPANGYYNVCLYAYDSLGYFCDSTCTSINFNSSTSNCDASFFTIDTLGNMEVLFIPNSSGGNYTYLWNFGDGTTSTSSTPFHQYTSYGTYIACLTVTDTVTNCVDVACDTITFQPCSAGLSLNQVNGSVYAYNGSAGGYTSLTWKIFDNSGNQIGAQTGGNYFAYQPATAGYYTVCVFTYNNGALCDSACAGINYLGQGQNCNVSFSIGQSLGTIQATNQSSGASSYTWNVYNANGMLVNTSSGYNLLYNTGIDGFYTVCLLGTDSLGYLCDSLCIGINATGNGTTGCSAGFNVINTINNYVQFQNTSTPMGTGIDYWWDFGDGTGGNSAIIGQADTSHTYANPGTYVVCLTVIDSINNCSDTYCDSVVIAAPGTCNVNFNMSQTGSVLNGSNNSTGGTTYEWFVYNNSWNQVYSSTATNLYYQPSANGLYHICLYAYDSLGYECDSSCASIVFTGAPVPCSANYAWIDSLGNGVVNFYAYFNAPGTSYTWSFGDGTTTTVGSNSVTHTYTSPGTYTVCLNVIDSINNCSAVLCDSIVIYPGNTQNCNAAFWSVDSAQTYYFVNNSTGNGLQYNWSFGDGNTSTQASPYHTYSAPGTYTVCLFVTDSINSCMDSTCSTITVTAANPNCLADYVWFLDSAFSSGQPNTVYIFNLSQGTNLSYLWDFGDGNTSTAAYPTHVYAQNGIYNVCLTVSDNLGCVHTYCDSIEYVQRAQGFTINVLPFSSAGNVDVEEVTAMEILNVYPNPAQEILYIEIGTTGPSDMVSLEITDMLGRVVMTESVSNSGTSTLHISSLQSGVYSLTIRSVTDRSTKRFFKK